MLVPARKPQQAGELFWEIFILWGGLCSAGEARWEKEDMCAGSWRGSCWGLE